MTTARPTPPEPADFTEAVVAVLEGLERGDVVTYGEVAAEAGFPGAARAVGARGGDGVERGRGHLGLRASEGMSDIL